MLGWLHQALASERVLVLALLSSDAVTDTRPTASRFSKSSESDSLKSEPDITFVLDRIFEGACQPFKVRVEQVLQSQPSLIVSFKLSNTLEFYSYTISDSLGRETALCNNLGFVNRIGFLTADIDVKKNGVGNVVDDDGDKGKKMKGEIFFGENACSSDNNNKVLPCMDRLREELSCALLQEMFEVCGGQMWETMSKVQATEQRAHAGTRPVNTNSMVSLLLALASSWSVFGCHMPSNVCLKALVGRWPFHQLVSDSSKFYTLNLRRLVFSCGLDLVCMYDPDDFYIRNPATREQITLPRKSSGFPGHGGHAVAFAYLPSTGEYKVLRVFGVSPFLSLQHPIRRSEVFTLGSGRWREKEGPSFWVHDDNSAVVDEAVHFLPGIFTWRLAVGDLHHDDDEAIARFDLKKEKWSKLPLPGIRHFSRDSRDEAWDFRLTRLGGSLCMECSGRSRVDLWLLEEGRNSCASWVKAYSIDRCCYPHQLEERCWRGPTASCRSTTQRKNELKRRSLVGRATSGSAST
ncbi:uncharacterized protein A4U43_UnF7060 [Asparagus officinalis]|uniref:Uncharacterized protein n=1 Tax=Asparagus officinalis TaxID=4686 RepID=A0A1R3L6C1_ASPOF|nr:uncharacterized protein A4U43_UnF7060 [Asparagus officinalis]